MKISLNWLSEYIELDDYRKKLPEISRILTAAGLEVEEMVNPADHWNMVVVGHLLEVGKHPDADKLTLCQVDVGEDKPLQIVCGAQNHKTGDNVAVAKVGAVLKGDFKIKASKIRGVESFGMLCSNEELGLAAGSDGILILNPELKIGTPLAQVNEYSDVVFELNVTPNRADCLSHIGLARELSTLLDRKIKLPQASFKEVGEKIDDQISVKLIDADSCPRYCGRMIKGVKIQDSPPWLKSRIESIGLKSINNVVDVTNYVLFEYGQPLHAFDFNKIKQHKITIEKAKNQEEFKTLDGTSLKLSELDLVIRDGEKPVALAGVVGGLDSGVSTETVDLFIESAFFKSEGVRRTSRAHGVETDSCYRFSRGVDPEQTLKALDRATVLIQSCAGGEVQKGFIDLYPKPLKRNNILITTQQVSERLGFEVKNNDFQNWMLRLGCKVQSQGDQFDITPPSFRWDINIKEDLIEEFARLNGYDSLAENLPQLSSEPTLHDPMYIFTRKITKTLSGLGLKQALNYAFIGPSDHNQVWSNYLSSTNLGLSGGDRAIELLNPISEELSVMRESILPSLLKNLVFNERHGHHYGRLFEIAPVSYQKDKQFLQENRLAFVFWGQSTTLWNKEKKNVVVYELKSVIEALLSSMGGKNWRWQQSDESTPTPPGFHPSQSASLFYEGKTVGLLGTLHPAIKDQLKIRNEVAWCELNFDSLSLRQPRSPQFKSIPKFPSVERDLAFLAPMGLASEQILSEIKKGAGPLLTELSVFDLYQDKDLEAMGRKSIAFRLRFQSDKETLNDEIINQIRDKIVNSVCQKLGLEIR